MCVCMCAWACVSSSGTDDDAFDDPPLRHVTSAAQTRCKSIYSGLVCPLFPSSFFPLFFSLTSLSISLLLSVYLSLPPSFSAYLSPSLCLSISLPVYLFPSLSLSIYFPPSLCLSISLPLSVYLALSLSLSVSIYLPPSLCFYISL